MQDEILTMAEAAEILKMTEQQVFELTRRRSQERHDIPFPSFKLHHKALRVRRSDLDRWIETLATQGRAQSVGSAA
jgi:predicted DNA-binding transcriptional regulator AlpA